MRLPHAALMGSLIASFLGSILKLHALKLPTKTKVAYTNVLAHRTFAWHPIEEEAKPRDPSRSGREDLVWQQCRTKGHHRAQPACLIRKGHDGSVGSQHPRVIWRLRNVREDTTSKQRTPRSTMYGT